MICSLNDLKCNELINVETGEKIGFIDDIEFEPENGTVIAFIIYGRMRFWGIFGKEDDIILTCQDVRLIGKDTILVKLTGSSYVKSSIRKNKNLKKLKKGIDF